MTKALEVAIDGKVVGTFVPPKGIPISAVLANIPKTYMRAQCFCISNQESWYWQLPDVAENQVISFKLVETAESGTPPRIEINNRTDNEAKRGRKSKRFE